MLSEKVRFLRAGRLRASPYQSRDPTAQTLQRLSPEYHYQKTTMQTWNRRQWLAAAGGLSAAAQLGCQRKEPPVKKGVAIDEYEPKSMLHVTETKVPARASR